MTTGTFMRPPAAETAATAAGLTVGMGQQMVPESVAHSFGVMAVMERLAWHLQACFDSNSSEFFKLCLFLASVSFLKDGEYLVGLGALCVKAIVNAFATFYTRNFADKIPDLLVSFWPDESEHVRMAPRTLFHCAASRSRAIPLPLHGQKLNAHVKLVRSLSEIGEHEDQASKAGAASTRGLASDMSPEPQVISQADEYMRSHLKH